MSETRSVTTLQAARDAVAHQRDWFAELRAEVAGGRAARRGERRLAARAPPRVRRARTSSTSGGRRSSRPSRSPGQYLAVLRDRGYPDWTDQYGSLALASSLADDDDPPWGGLPRPTFLVAHLTDDAQRKIFELWARESGAAFFGLSATVANDDPAELARDDPARLGGRHRQRPSRPHGRGAARARRA